MNKVLLEGLMTAATGIIVVLLGLILLIFAISLMRVFSGESKKAKPAQAEKPQTAPAALPVLESAPVKEDASVIAAISAAISLVLEAEGNQSGFIVRRIVRNKSHKL